MITLMNLKKGLVLILTNQIQKFVRVGIALMIKVIFIWKKNCKFKTLDNFSTYKFYLENISKDFVNIEMKEIKLNGAAFYFSNDYSLIGKDIYLKS